MKLLTKGFRCCYLAGSVLILFLLSGCAATKPAENASAELPGNLVEIRSRPGVTLKCLVIAPANPVAAVLFLKGGNGLFDMEENAGKIKARHGHGIIEGMANKMAPRGLLVTIPDAPSDKANGFNFEFRMQTKHLEDIKATVEYITAHHSLPVWLFGHSAGTLSAARVAVGAPSGSQGLILSAPATRMIKAWGTIHQSLPNGILDLDLARISVPTLIIYHRGDQCTGSPTSNIPKLAAAIPGSDTVTITGGKTFKGNPCGASSAHVFYGVESECFGRIADFILAHR